MKDKLLYWFFKVAGWALIAGGIAVAFVFLFAVAVFPEFRKTSIAEFLRPIVNLF